MVMRCRLSPYDTDHVSFLKLATQSHHTPITRGEGEGEGVQGAIALLDAYGLSRDDLMEVGASYVCVCVCIRGGGVVCL